MKKLGRRLLNKEGNQVEDMELFDLDQNVKSRKRILEGISEKGNPGDTQIAKGKRCHLDAVRIQS